MFALNWTEQALNELAEIYVTATVEERERMARGVDALNTRLRSDPLNEGESRTGGLRMTFPDLLSVWFRLTGPRAVRVVRVQRYGH
jgi:plasmid stabilization system protein ParE